MNKKTMEARFSAELDAYLNGIKRPSESGSDEYNKLLELGKALADNDFSQNSKQEEVFAKTIKTINENGGEVMKQSRLVKYALPKVAAVAMVCILGFSAMQTSFAQELAGKVLKTISLGHITVYEDEPRDGGSSIPAELKGEYFDKDGNPVEELSPDGPQQIYSADGKVVIGFGAEEAAEGKLIVKDPDKLNDYTCFNVILPSYLPEGFAFEKAQFYEDENATVEDTKYIGLYFTHQETGKYIYMQQRFADAETGYAAGGYQVEAIKINGADAVMYDRNLDWEANGVIYALSGRGVVANSELIKIAESIK